MPISARFGKATHKTLPKQVSSSPKKGLNTFDAMFSFSNNFKTELGWFCIGSVAAVTAGAILGWPTLSLLLFLGGYAIWLLYRMETIVSWLRAGGKVSRAPISRGLTDEMVELIHREKKYSRRQKNRFRTSLAQFNNLAANLPDAIIVINNDDEIRWSNPAARNLLNIHLEKDRGQRIDNLIRNPEFGNFLASEEDNAEVEIQGLVAAERILAVRKVPSRSKMTVLIAADITQRVKVREMRKAFVGDVSHELRTPLTVIRGYLEMLQENDTLEPSVAEAIGEVSAQSDRMNGIVEALLELSKLESNPLGDREGEPVNITSLVKSMTAQLKKESPQHIFNLDMDDALVLTGSETELYSACNNLLTNAIKYTEPGSVISVSWHLQSDGTARYQVADNGPGVESRHLPRLSERFYRVETSRSREQGGTGLGLAIVKHAVQRHGGTFDIQSTPGSGSQFSAVFPANRVQSLLQAANQ